MLVHCTLAAIESDFKRRSHAEIFRNQTRKFEKKLAFSLNGQRGEAGEVDKERAWECSRSCWYTAKACGQSSRRQKRQISEEDLETSRQGANHSQLKMNA